MATESSDSEAPPTKAGRKTKDKPPDKSSKKSSIRPRKPSTLQANIDQEKISKEELTIQTLEKKLKNARKKKNKSELDAKSKSFKFNHFNVLGSDIEDEDTPDEDTNVGPISCSIHSKEPRLRPAMEDPHLQLTAKHGPHRLKGRPLIRIEGDHLRNPVPKAHAPPVEAHHLAPPVVTHHYLFLVATPLKLRALLINLYQLRPAKHRLLEAGQPTSLPTAKIRPAIKVGRPNAGDYEDPACNILLHAAYDYSCQICTVNPFPTSLEQHEMATSAWKKACCKAGKSFELTARMKTVITARGSKIRGMIKDSARTLVSPTYGFDHTNTPATKVKNRESYLVLTQADSFHHKAPETRSQFAQHHIIYEILRTTFFNDREDLGVIFTSYFNPISLATLAIVITAVDFCLKEWSTGEFVKAKFYETAITIDYTSYLKKMQDWHGLAPEIVTKMLTKMHYRLRRDAGAGSSTLGALGGATAIGMSAAEKELALKELEGHMGDTESEGE
ncbi:hypothetical protein FIBSPDRAFT_1038523 [Athelia psychrophila]|uniref:DUF6532 domain-containing protein n=1 Tax=Athelia psychrophila TaxID=1759441 RepID=A0A166T505_9AGAM|nr:hypothetical protein FIBSPDRAFT_1038523 [Fibularhizoctonia sp. CBS 109695]